MIILGFDYGEKGALFIRQILISLNFYEIETQLLILVVVCGMLALITFRKRVDRIE